MPGDWWWLQARASREPNHAEPDLHICALSAQCAHPLSLSLSTHAIMQRGEDREQEGKRGKGNRASPSAMTNRVAAGLPTSHLASVPADLVRPSTVGPPAPGPARPAKVCLTGHMWHAFPTPFAYGLGSTELKEFYNRTEVRPVPALHRSGSGCGRSFSRSRIGRERPGQRTDLITPGIPWGWGATPPPPATTTTPQRETRAVTASCRGTREASFSVLLH